MNKYFCTISMCTILSLYGALTYAATVEGLRCEVSSGPTPTKYVLYKREAPSTAYVIAQEQPKCEFTNVTIPDTTETCFKYGAANDAGTTIRNDVAICVDPRLAPLSPPKVLHIR